MTLVEAQKRSTAPWWIAGAGLAAWAALFLTPWSVVAVTAIIAVSIYRLTRSPSRAEKVMLWLVIIVLTITLALLLITTLVTLGLETSIEQPAIEIESP